MAQVLWFPYLLKQRQLGVKDLRDVNFKATLANPRFSELEMWKPYSNSVQHGGYDPDLKPNDYLDKGSTPPELTTNGEPYQNEDNDWVADIIPIRGQPVHFKYKGYTTFLFQDEFDLIKEILPHVLEITITTTDGLSPQFNVLAVVKKD